MSFLQRFLERVLRNNPSRMARTSFDDLNQEQLDAHLRVGRYGNFSLTDAVRPSIGLEVIPREGYRRDTYCDPESGNKMPVLAASVSGERLFDVFMDLLDPLGDVVDVVMESSHESRAGQPRRPLPRAHGHGHPQEHPLRLRAAAAPRRLHRPRRAQPERADGSPVRRAQAPVRLRPRPRAVRGDPDRATA